MIDQGQTKSIYAIPTDVPYKIQSRRNKLIDTTINHFSVFELQLSIDQKNNLHFLYLLFQYITPDMAKTIVFVEVTTPPPSLMTSSSDPVTFVFVHYQTFVVVAPSSMMMTIMAGMIIPLPSLLYSYHSRLLLVAQGYKIICNGSNN